MDYSNGSSTAICELCKKNNHLYTCPQCGIKYCGLECYKSEAHLDCSENFYKQCVIDELKYQESDPDNRKKMLEILKRVEAADLGEILEDNEEGDDICNDENCSLDSDDEELLDLETRLQNVNFENPDELWSVLSDTEKQEFESLLKNGELEKILPAWTPWWAHSVQKKITELNRENIEDTDVSKLPAIVDVPLFPELQKASSSVQFNIVNVIYAYAYIALYYYGDYLNCSEDATHVFLMICENMRNNTIFENADSAIESVIKCIKSVEWLARDKPTLEALREAGNSIMRPVTAL
ncbi:zinc finger HIT domain-containing protein 2 isoform X2 [Pseudomyrmex gracilis]|uniref:zinc finger HIT domain-containing protein 2 isoform X2 n=1 Tax=Pseudomyrmex gracilis TaxID=219809 RepID=UPI000995C876|nr:zinc finger HIT domain-containing protein 2 isoform X2 [Pseudomyrmex gracilis]